ncbi:MAG: hypothetical protein M3619_28610 [Myxococcota bacterium]|nr:hypothetical protein [Myxococcota bacterium]
MSPPTLGSFTPSREADVHHVHVERIFAFMKRVRALVVSCLLGGSASLASAGPYTTGLGGGGGLNLFPHGFFPNGSGPIFAGAGYSHGLQETRGAVYLRFGVGLVEYDSYVSLARPSWMFALELGVHLLDEAVLTFGASYQHGMGPFLVGGAVAFASSEREDTSLGILLAPEVSLPLRAMVRRSFTPSAIVFARFELAATVRDVFEDRFLTGVALAFY